MAKKRGLGRPLDALLGGASTQREKAAAKSATADAQSVAESDATQVVTKPEQEAIEAPVPAIVPAAGDRQATTGETEIKASGDTLRQIAVDRNSPRYLSATSAF